MIKFSHIPWSGKYSPEFSWSFNLYLCSRDSFRSGVQNFPILCFCCSESGLCTFLHSFCSTFPPTNSSPTIPLRLSLPTSAICLQTQSLYHVLTLVQMTFPNHTISQSVILKVALRITGSLGWTRSFQIDLAPLSLIWTQSRTRILLLIVLRIV